MTKAICVCWHKYTPFGEEYYEPLLDFFLSQMEKYKDEYDTLYLVDSTWKISPATHHLPDNVIVIKVNPSLRYYDAYKEVLPQIKEDVVLLLDNDLIIYRENIITRTFQLLEQTDEIWNYDVVSIVQNIGTMKVPLKLGNKFAAFFLATRKDLLTKYLDINWGPEAMPYTETMGLLTEAMLKDGCKVYEMEDDQSNILFDGTKDGEKGKDLGYYHIRSGSVPAVLLAWKNSPDHQQQYQDYIKNQPKSEILRACAWYEYMEGNPTEVLLDLSIDMGEWTDYMDKFIKYHGLE